MSAKTDILLSDLAHLRDCHREDTDRLKVLERWLEEERHKPCQCGPYQDAHPYRPCDVRLDAILTAIRSTEQRLQSIRADIRKIVDELEPREYQYNPS